MDLYSETSLYTFIDYKSFLGESVRSFMQINMTPENKSNLSFLLLFFLFRLIFKHCIESK